MKVTSVVVLVTAAVVLIALSLITYSRPEAHILLDRDDSAFFETSRKLSNLGDHEFALAAAALDKNKLEFALRFSQHAEKAYHNAMEYGKYKQARELAQTLESTIKTKDKAKKMQMALYIAKAKKKENDLLAIEAQRARLAEEAKMHLVVYKASQVCFKKRN
jgi:CRISPR/Cas system-associated endoribonuclease Cas2